MSNDKRKPEEQQKLRDHVYDGIQEYDARLPNWWLWTLYAAMIFGFAYWFYYQMSGPKETAMERVDRKMAELAARAEASPGVALTDEKLWKMSRDQVTVTVGKDTFMTTCASCHGKNLEGGIGQNLVDDTWVHGGNPTDVLTTVSEGILAKGMPAWGPVLGKTRVSEVVAFIMSHHKEKP